MNRSLASCRHLSRCWNGRRRGDSERELPIFQLGQSDMARTLVSDSGRQRGHLKILSGEIRAVATTESEVLFRHGLDRSVARAAAAVSPSAMADFSSYFRKGHLQHRPKGRKRGHSTATESS